MASLSQQIAAADKKHAQAKAARNAAQDARKEEWREADELSEQHKAAEAEYSKANEVRVYTRVGNQAGERCCSCVLSAVLALRPPAVLCGIVPCAVPQAWQRSVPCELLEGLLQLLGLLPQPVMPALPH